MSTVPGESTWVDAGLVGSEEDILQVDGHLPAVPRPDLLDQAAEPDVVEQALDAGGDEDEYDAS